jgi:hypothetical protein
MPPSFRSNPPLHHSFGRSSLSREQALRWDLMGIGAPATSRHPGFVRSFLSIHSVLIRWRPPRQRAATRAHRSWGRSHHPCGSWGSHCRWRCLLVRPRCRGLDLRTGFLHRTRAPRWTSPQAARVALAGGADESRRKQGHGGLLLWAGSGSGDDAGRSLPSFSSGRRPRPSACGVGIFNRRPLYCSQRHLLLSADPQTGGRTKNWAETVLALILGRDSYT